MATPQDRLESALAAAVKAARELGEGTVSRITVDPQESGQCPYQVSVLEDQLPVVGVTQVPSPTATPSGS